MWNEWTYWLSSIPPDRLLLLVMPLLLFDGVRYCLTTVCVWLNDRLAAWMPIGHQADPASAGSRYCPTVSLILPGLNEGASLGTTLEKLWGSYPRLQIIVVDDGSTDNMLAVAREFAGTHQQVTVISKPRGGKSSAANAGLARAKGEITIVLDADSDLSPGAIWRIVQPLADPTVGAVSGNVRVRNASHNLLTRM